MSTYRLKQTSNGQFHFVLRAGNGEIILHSETYKYEDAALKGIESVRVNSSNPARYVRKNSENNKPMFNLIAANGEVIGTSQLYSSVQTRDEGISSVQSNGPISPIV